MDIKYYVDIMTEEKLSSIYVAITPVIYWSVLSHKRREGDRVKCVKGGNHYFSPVRVSFY